MRARTTSGRPDQDRPGEALVQQHLHGAQHALLLAVGEHHAHRPLARPLEDRLHGQPERNTNCDSRSR